MALDRLSLLPVELKQHLFSYLNVIDICKARRLNRNIKAFLDDPSNQQAVLKPTFDQEKSRLLSDFANIVDTDDLPVAAALKQCFDHYGCFDGNRQFVVERFVMNYVKRRYSYLCWNNSGLIDLANIITELALSVYGQEGQDRTSPSALGILKQELQGYAVDTGDEHLAAAPDAVALLEPNYLPLYPHEHGFPVFIITAENPKVPQEAENAGVLGRQKCYAEDVIEQLGLPSLRRRRAFSYCVRSMAMWSLVRNASNMSEDLSMFEKAAILRELFIW
jgi:hypothetical protein